MINGEKISERPIRWAMIGGGRGSQIGYIHRSAALRDANFELVAGAFDINPERIAAEKNRPDGVQAVSIATPNFTHFEIAKAALEAGLHVYCEKPLCFTVAEAEELEALVKSSGKIMFVSYGYAGHQMIEQVRLPGVSTRKNPVPPSLSATRRNSPALFERSYFARTQN